MVKCTVCDAELQSEQKTCHICGSHVETASPVPVSTNAASVPEVPEVVPPAPSDSKSEPDPSVSGERECPDCGKVFGTDFADDFCPCGTELRPRTVGTDAPAISQNPASVEPLVESPPATAGSVRPPAGTVCLVVYSDTKPRQPVKYFPINKDVVLMGRQDAVRGDFPDLDFTGLLDEAAARKVSRRHAELLRARSNQSYLLRPLPGNTGTQVGKELASPGKEYPLTDGTPIVLGGAVWMKFETMK
ncbi:MAG: FHA domain-containing protein [Planctomycetaceae bacterium]